MTSFKFLGVPVNIHPTFLLILLLFSGLYKDFSIESVILGVIFGLSLLVHEYGHAFAVLYFGEQPEINLEAFGGTTNYRTSFSDNQSLIVTVCGPLLESVLIIVPYFLLKSHYFENYYANYILYITMRLNIFWLIFNLIPIIPLDGGHIAKYFIHQFSEENGTRVSLVLGIFAAIVGTGYYLCEGHYIFGGLLFFYGLKNLRAFQAGVGIKNTAPFALYNRGIRHLENNEIAEAKKVFRKLLKSKDESIQAAALESLTPILCQENREKEAYQLLLQGNMEKLKSGKCLLCKLAFKQRNFTLIEKYSREIYEIEPTYEIAMLNSRAFASLNDPILAAGWLQTANLFKGFPKQELVEAVQHMTYDQVRHHEAFQSRFDEISEEICRESSDEIAASDSALSDSALG